MSPSDTYYYVLYVGMGYLLTTNDCLSITQPIIERDFQLFNETLAVFSKKTLVSVFLCFNNHNADQFYFFFDDSYNSCVTT